MRIYWLQILDEYWGEKDTLFSGNFYFYPDWLYQYFNEILLREAI